MHIMIDLETLGTKPDCAILAIGACNDEGHTLYVKISIESNLRLGREIDASTLRWWMEQSDEARKEAFSGKEELAAALLKLRFFIKQYPKPVVWGNGATFDISILENAYGHCDIDVPWAFWNVRCFRTAMALSPNVERCKPTLKHHALSDAKAQMMTLKMILEAQ